MYVVLTISPPDLFVSCITRTLSFSLLAERLSNQRSGPFFLNTKPYKPANQRLVSPEVVLAHASVPRPSRIVRMLHVTRRVDVTLFLTV